MDLVTYKGFEFYKKLRKNHRNSDKNSNEKTKKI